MKKLPLFKITLHQRDGIKRAAQWHERQAKIFRYSIANRIKHKVTYAEHLFCAEQHEEASLELRRLLKLK